MVLERLLGKKFKDITLDDFEKLQGFDLDKLVISYDNVPPEKFNNLANQTFEKVLARAARPPIFGPHIIPTVEKGNGNGTAYIDLISRNVAINEPFVRSVAETTIDDLEDKLTGIIAHEFIHYLFHPYSVGMTTYLSVEAKKKFEDFGESIMPLYIDLCDNFLALERAFFDRELGGLLDVSTSAKHHEQKFGKYSLTTEAMRRTYSWFGFDFEPSTTLTPEDDKMVNDVVEILKKSFTIDLAEEDKLDPRTKEPLSEKELHYRSISINPVGEDVEVLYEKTQMIRFGNAILPLLEEDRKRNSNSQLPDKGHYIDKEAFDKLPSDVKDAIKDSVRQELAKTLTKGAYERIFKEMFGSEKKEGVPVYQGIGDRSSDTNYGDEDTVRIYIDAAKERGTVVTKPRKQDSVKRQAMTPIARPFSPSAPASAHDFRFSGGKIIPPLMATYDRRKILVPTTEDKLCELLLAKDVSGSMNDPRQNFDPSTVFSVMVAYSYFKSGYPVGVVLFDGASDAIVYPKTLFELVSVLTGYKGGGTSIDMELLAKELGKDRASIKNLDSLGLTPAELNRYRVKQARLDISGSNKGGKGLVDFVIVTDGGISNLNELLDFCENNPHYRPTFIHDQRFNLDIPGYDQKTSGMYGNNGRISVKSIGADTNLMQVGKDFLYDEFLRAK